MTHLSVNIEREKSEGDGSRREDAGCETSGRGGRSASVTRWRRRGREGEAELKTGRRSLRGVKRVCWRQG